MMIVYMLRLATHLHLVQDVCSATVNKRTNKRGVLNPHAVVPEIAVIPKSPNRRRGEEGIGAMPMLCVCFSPSQGLRVLSLPAFCTSRWMDGWTSACLPVSRCSFDIACLHSHSYSHQHSALCCCMMRSKEINTSRLLSC